jgi:major membrane immunogen (membrane-anchored lipoprotein)
MVVTVYNDSDETKNGIYYCSNKGGNIEFADGTSEWVRAGGGDGTLTGGTVVNNRISGATSSGFTSYFGEVVAVTGGTYNNGTITLSGSGSLSNITGFNVLSGTGISAFTFDTGTYDLTLKDNNNTTYTRSLSILASDLRVTGGTYDSGTGVATFTNNSGGTFPVNGFLVNYTNFYTTASTYNQSTGIITFNRTDLQPAYSATGFNYVTGFTVNSSNTISGYTNISGTTVAYGGVINAVTGGSYSNGTLRFSGSGNILSGVTITGLTDNYTTGSTYNPSTGIINFSGAGSQPQYSATGFNYVTGGSYTNGTLSLVTNTGQTISITGFSISTTFTGGTVTGATNFTNGLTANTISATTYFNLPTDIRVTGGTFNNGTITFTNNTGGTFTVTGIPSQFTGGTVTGATNFTNGLTANTISATTYFNLPTDIRVTGGTYSSGTITFTNNTGGTFTVTGLNTSTTFTGGTVTGATNFTNGLTANTISATTYFNLPTDVRVTGGTYSSGTSTFTNNTGGTFTVTGFTHNAATGGTYSNGTISLSGTGQLGGITGFNVLSGTGISAFTFNTGTYDLTLTDNNNQSYTRSLSILSSDMRVTGGTYDSGTGVATFTNNSGGTFNVSGFLVDYRNYYTTGSTYNPSTGIVTFNRTDLQPAYSATGFNYVTGFTISSANTISGYTNISGTSVAFGGTINAITGGSFSNGTLRFSGTGNILSGITGFGTGSATVTGGTDNFVTKWSGTSALTVSQIFDNGTNVGIGVTGASVTNKLHISASTNPLRIQGIQQSAQTQSSTKFLMIDNNDVVFWNNVTPTTGISIYITGFTSNFGLNGEKPVVDFIPSGTTELYRGASYQYLITANNFPTTRTGTLQGLWTSGASPYVSYSDVGPTQITNGTDAIIRSIYFSAVTGGINVVVDCGGGSYTLKAYRVLL